MSKQFKEALENSSALLAAREASVARIPFNLPVQATLDIQAEEAPLTLESDPQQTLSEISTEMVPLIKSMHGSLLDSPLRVPTDIPTLPLPSVAPKDRKPGSSGGSLPEEVQRYANWLARQSQHEKRRSDPEMELYIQEATVALKVGGKEIAPFAPFRPELSALQTFTIPQVLFLCLLGVLWMVSVLFFHLEALSVVVSAITIIYTFCLLLNMGMAIRSLHSTSEEHIDDALVELLKEAEWPFYTVLCPLYREAQVVPQFVQAMQALDYPQEKLQILLLTEEHDHETRAAIQSMDLSPCFQVLVVPEGMPRTKPRACNYGLLYATGSYTVIYDAEDIPDPLQLKKAVLAFANADLQTVCVQARLNFYNSQQNLLTRWFTAEYSTWFGFILPGLQAANFVLPLGGTSNHFRTASLRALGGWDAYNVTEDCDLGLRLKRFRLKTVILDSTTLEEANPDLKNWLRQRSRWIKGYMQTYLVHMRRPFRTLLEGRIYDFFSFQVIIGSGTGMLFFNPLMWLLLILFLVFGPRAVTVYHLIFPGPILYLGAFCLIFGNLFYLYLYLLACAKRNDYHLILWTLFVPIYWLLMSFAGLYAFVELLVRPHYWQKTKHGLHLKEKQQKQRVQEATAFVREHTQTLTPIRAVVQDGAQAIPRTIASTMNAISTLPLPAISLRQKHATRRAKRARIRDPWLGAIIVFSCALSVLACWYYFQNHDILLYEDALSHMRISRSVFDNLTPGLAQIGSVWLPLPHILMWPFVWNDYLWHSGLAGSFVSMPCYVLACIYLYLAARRITGSSWAAFLGALAFALNPNVLYLQSTPLSETVCLATSTMTCYYFIVWIQKEQLSALVATAVCAFLATLSRYDGWPLFLAIMCFIPLIGLLRKRKYAYIQGNLLIFVVLGGLGVILWLAWNKVIFGDPLYFQRSAYSSQSQQMVQFQLGRLFAYHDLWLSLKYYTVDAQQTIGDILSGALIIGTVWFLLKYRWQPITCGFLLYFVPFGLYVLTLYNGNAIIWLPGVVPQGAAAYLYNVRYGVQMVPAIAIAVAFLAKNVRIARFPALKPLVFAILLGLIIFQTVLIQTQGIISLQDGEYNFSCRAPRTTITYLAQHYNGGYILQDVFAAGYDATDAGIDFHDIVYEGAGTAWTEALRDPAQHVDWILVNPGNPSDLVAAHLDLTNATFLSEFVVVASQDDGVVLYHRIQGTSLANRPAPVHYTYPHHVCVTAS